MKKKLFDTIMFWLSIIYLIGAIVLILTQKIEWNIVNFFNTDGLALLGCLFAVGELVLSKRNLLSKRINQILMGNRVVQYRIGIVLKLTQEMPIEFWVDSFEKNLKDGLQINDLSKKVISEIVNDSCKMYYETYGCMFECYKMNETINVRIVGKEKYGNIHSRKKDILYFSLLVEIINSKLLQEDIIRRMGTVKSVELSVIKKGSQMFYSNIFNSELKEIVTYDALISDKGQNNIQFLLSSDEITMKMINVTSIMEGFVDFTNLLCTIE